MNRHPPPIDVLATALIWINDDEEDFIEQNMLDAQNMSARLSSHGLPSQNELIILVKEHKMNWLSFVEHLKLTVDNLSDESITQDSQ